MAESRIWHESDSSMGSSSYRVQTSAVGDDGCFLLCRLSLIEEKVVKFLGIRGYHVLPLCPNSPSGLLKSIYVIC